MFSATLERMIVLKKTRALLFSITFLVLFTSVCHSTMIVVIVTKDGYWVGADSLRSDGQGSEEQVCKIHETADGLWVKFGSSQGITESGEYYPTDLEIKDLLNKYPAAQDFKKALPPIYAQQIMTDTLRLFGQSKNFKEFGNNLFPVPIPKSSTEGLSRGILFLPSREDLGKAEVFNALPESFLDRNIPNKWDYRLGILNWNQLDDGHILYQPLVKVENTRSDDWILEHPKETLSELLDRGHQLHGDMVGPPYVIVQITYPKSSVNPSINSTSAERTPVTWIEKGVCPSWSDKIIPFNDENPIKPPISKSPASTNKSN